jgi:hypothetical protein
MQERQFTPLDVGQVIGVSFKLYRTHFLTLLKTVAVVIVPVTILGLLITLGTAPAGAFIRDGQIVAPTQSQLARFFVGLGVGVLVQALGALLATGMAFKAVVDAYLNRKAEASESLSFAARRLPALVWLSILTALILIVAFVALIIPGIYLAVAFAVSVPILLVEDTRGSKALARSRELVKGRWWPVLGTIFFGGLIVGLISGVIGFIFDGLVVKGADTVASNIVWSWVGNAISSIITTPFWAALLAVLYFDLRSRKEGIDIAAIGRSVTDPQLPSA